MEGLTSQLPASYVDTTLKQIKQIQAAVPWWKESDSTPASTDTVSSGVASQLCSSGSSSVGQSSTGNGNGNGKEEISDIIRKYQEFKHFDTVDDCSDHHFNITPFQGQQPPKAWSKKIQSEWKILEKDLPDTIYVRVYESRMDLLRAVIVGPQGTPYHDGLFVFDVLLPSTYPDTPPGTEKWQPNTSTMLQVLVSIQGLILNENPFFNEPGYESTYVGSEGERRSKAYTENVFIMSLKTMMYTLKRPPKHFEDLVTGHFHIHAHDILSACKAYSEGASVGFADRGKPEGDNVPDNGRTRDFKAALTKITNVLVSTFTKFGVKDCEQFRITG
nr:putative ubiquitin-conjugating enzyme E2 38 [Ipomoea batatas]